MKRLLLSFQEAIGCDVQLQKGRLTTDVFEIVFRAVVFLFDVGVLPQYGGNLTTKNECYECFIASFLQNQQHTFVSKSGLIFNSLCGVYFLGVLNTIFVCKFFFAKLKQR